MGINEYTKFVSIKLLLIISEYHNMTILGRRGEYSE